MPESVDGGSIDPVDALVQSLMDGADRLIIVLCAPGKIPVAAANGPGTEADRGQFEVRVAECFQGKGNRLCHHNSIDAWWLWKGSIQAGLHTSTWEALSTDDSCHCYSGIIEAESLSIFKS